MSFEFDATLRRELATGERLLWSGRPRQGLLLRGSDVLLIPFSLLWGGFAFFWEYTVLQKNGAPIFFSLWGVPFVLLGIYIIVGRFFVDSYLRARTVYGVTDRRILILSGLTSIEVRSLPLRNLAEISLRESSNRSGGIIFGPTNAMLSMWAGTAWPGMSRKAPPSFEFIEDVRAVYGLVRDTQHKATE